MKTQHPSDPPKHHIAIRNRITNHGRNKPRAPDGNFPTNDKTMKRFVESVTFCRSHTSIRSRLDREVALPSLFVDFKHRLAKLAAYPTSLASHVCNTSSLCFGASCRRPFHSKKLRLSRRFFSCAGQFSPHFSPCRCHTRQSAVRHHTLMRLPARLPRQPRRLPPPRRRPVR